MVARLGAWLVPTRLWLAGLGIACLVGMAIFGDPGLSNRFAQTAIAAFAIATLLLWLEGVRQAKAEGDASRADFPGWRIGLLGLAVGAGALVQTWFHVGTTIAVGDIPPPLGTAWISRLSSPWAWSGLNLGGPAALELHLPWALVLGSVQGAGGSPELAQRIWYTVLFVGAAVSAFTLLTVLSLRPLPAVFGSGAYLLNAYVISIVNINPVFLAALGLMPAYLAILLAASRRIISVRNAGVLIALTAPMLGYIYQNPPLVGMLLALLLVSPAWAAWLHGRAAAARCLRAVILGLPLLLCLSAYWLIPAIEQVGEVATNQLAPLSTWAWTEVRATLANGFWLNTTWAWRHPEYYPFAAVYADWPMSAIKFGLPILAFGALLIGSRASGELRRDAHLPIVSAAATAALLVIFLSTGTNPPGNVVFNVLYALPYGWLLREPGRFLMVAALAYALLATVLTDGLFHGNWLGNLFRRRLTSKVVRSVLIAAAAALIILPGFPVFTGVIVSDERPVLPPEHVRVPGYWPEMAAFVDNAPYSGAVLIMPPDDFYQMPYTWGYYGVDGFIPQLLTRPVLVPNSQAYTRSNIQLTTAVDLTAESIVGHDWLESSRLLGVLRAPLVLVRGDVDLTFPGRNIVSPAAISNALKEAPNFRLLHQAGPLALFALLDPIPSTLERVSSYVTVNTSNPDLRILSILPAGSALVSSGPEAGVPNVLQAPPVSEWAEDGARLTWSLVEAPGWTYDLWQLGNTPPRKLIPPTATSGTGLTGGFAAALHKGQAGQDVLDLRLEGRSALHNGDFSRGVWGPVQDCYNLLGDAASSLLQASIIDNEGPAGRPALRLAAKADSACEVQQLTWSGGPLYISLKARHLSGDPARLCLWQSGPQHCAQLPAIPDGTGWLTYRATVAPEPGTTALALHLYADASSAGATTINEYADVRVVELPLLPRLALVGKPSSDSSGGRQLAVLHSSYASSWRGPVSSRHVLVDGLINGWLVHPAPPQFSVSYEGARAVTVGFAISALGALLVLILCLYRPFRRICVLASNVLKSTDGGGSRP
jgi:hypothetical protein